MQNNQTREMIYSTLFKLLKTSYNWNYSSRHVLMWSDVGLQMQPAMFMRQHLEVADQTGLNAGLTRWHLRTQVWIYVQASPASDEPGNFPMQTLNPILDAVETALKSPIPGSQQTLADFNNGIPLVERTWIDGTVLVNDPVSPDLQIVAVIPVTMTVGL